MYPKIFLLLLSLLLLSCKEQREEQVYSTLKNHQAKAILSINNSHFYQEDSIFEGEINISGGYFSLDFMDQYKNNIKIGISGQNLYAQKPVSMKKMQNGSVMIGKVIDSVNNVGEGYLMTDGELQITSLSEDKISIQLHGKVERYMTYNQSKTLNGFIICKKPAYIIDKSIEKKALFF